MPDDDSAHADDEVPDEAQAPARELRRDRAITAKRRIQLAEELASKAAAAELEGDHKTAANLYREAIDALAYLAETAIAVVDDTAGTDDDSA